MKKIINIILLLTVSIALGDTYIVKFKNQPDNLTTFQSKYNGIKLSPAIIGNHLNNDKSKNSFLSAPQISRLKELQKYYIVETDNPEILQSIPEITGITPNYIYKAETLYNVPNDKLYNSQWSLKQVSAQSAWQKATGKGVIIGLIDTGIDFEHEDLRNKLWINNPEDINKNGQFDPWPSDEIVNNISGDLNGIDEDGNGYIDDVIGFDLVDQEYTNYGDYSIPDAIPEDEGEHGTPVAGIMAAETDNNEGISSIAPDALILTAKCLDATGNGEADDIANAIIYAVINGADILNFSFGEVYHSPIIHDAIKFAYSSGVTMVASSGNNGWALIHYPSDYPEVISIGGTDENGNRFGKSNYGSFLDFIAPGYFVYTTGINDTYSRESGTSISAPIVSGAAALLKEKNPDLKPEEIRGILHASAYDIEEEGWDEKTGSGIIDISKALDFTGKTDINIYSPEFQSVINHKNNEKVQFIGNVITPLFDKYEVFYGEGILPENWDKIGETKFTQIKDSVIAEYDFTKYPDNADDYFTIRILVYLKNKKTIERRFRYLYSNDSLKLKLVSFNQRDGFEENRLIHFIYAQTNIPAIARVEYRKKGSEEYQIASDQVSKETYHLIKIENFVYDTEYEARAVFISDSVQSVTEEFEFTVNYLHFTEENFNRKNYSFQRSYITEKAEEIYNNNKKIITINDLSNLSIGQTYLYQLSEGKFEQTEIGQQGWIGVGYGDSDGDGVIEFLGKGNGKTVIYEKNTSTDKFFNNLVYESNDGEINWAEHFYDLDGDGDDEIIANDSYSYYVIDYKNNNYEKSAVAALPENLAPYGVNNNSLIDDFDGDGKPELVHSNSYGFLYIHEYAGNSFVNEFTDSSIISASNQYFTKADINNDGLPEIIQLSAGTRFLFSRDLPVKNIWYLRVFGYDSGEYKQLTDYVFFGTREGYILRLGFSYRNGLGAGNIDNILGDEVIISVFPNLYVLGFDDNLNPKPMWHYPFALSNKVIVDDFDENGINEIGFSAFDSTYFYEYNIGNDAPATPTGIDGWSLSDTSVYLEWDKISDAELYQIYIIDFSGNNPTAELTSLTETNEIKIDSLEKNQYYSFAVVSYNSQTQNNLSEFSEVIEIYTHNLYFPKNIEFINEHTFKINYSGSLKIGTHNTGSFEIISDNLKIFPQTAVMSGDTSVIITMPFSLKSGDYKIIIDKIRDKYNSFTIKDTLGFNINITEDGQELYLKQLEIFSQNLIKLKFSEKVNAEEATNPENYVIKPFGNVEYIDMGTDDSTFVLMNISTFFRSNAARGFDYTLTAKNITSQNGSEMTKGPGNTLGFVISAQTLDNAYIYPNPVKLSDFSETYFANITKNATVSVLSLDGSLLRKLVENDGNGGIEWDLKDETGKTLQPGIYLFKVEGINDSGYNQGPILKKFMIIK